MSSREKVPHMLRFLEAERLSPRIAASVQNMRPHRNSRSAPTSTCRA
jgi:hypothetical protein